MDLTVIIATYNRAEDLHQTLEAMANVDRRGLSVEFIVVDNNSTDDTQKVVQSFSGRLPVRCIFESRRGKCCALNRALDAEELGGIVVVTDDDVTPCEGWFRAIKSACTRWPEYSVFGGRVETQWPGGRPPCGSRRPGARMFGLGSHEHGLDEQPYLPNQAAHGTNWWVRREVLKDERRFDETLGPGSGRVAVGDETLFMLTLIQDGYSLVYVPTAMVNHRIQKEKMLAGDRRRRAFSTGRSGPHVGGICQRRLLERSPIAWYGKRLGVLGWSVLRYLVSHFGLSSERAVAMRLVAAADVGYNLESLAIVRRQRRDGKTLSGQRWKSA